MTPRLRIINDRLILDNYFVENETFFETDIILDNESESSVDTTCEILHNHNLRLFKITPFLYIFYSFFIYIFIYVLFENLYN